MSLALVGSRLVHRHLHSPTNREGSSAVAARPPFSVACSAIVNDFGIELFQGCIVGPSCKVSVQPRSSYVIALSFLAPFTRMSPRLDREL